MAEENAKLEEQVKALRKEMDDLLQQRREFGSTIELAERITAMEDSRQDAFGWDAATPDTSRSGDLMDTRKMPTSLEDESEVIPFEIEFGKPTANVTTDVATVTLQPCDQGGTSFANADTVTNYVANDRQVQDTKNRGWTTASILSFIRFSPWVSGTPNIEGYLIGEDVRVDPGFWAEITGNATDGTNRWKYAFSEAHKTSAGYGGWATLGGGRSGTTGSGPARNTIEDMNTGADAHVEGNGVDPANLDPAETGSDTFAIMPCTSGNIVRMHEVDRSGTTEYWFSYENGVDGDCGP